MTVPGMIRYTSPMSSLRFGEADGSLSSRAIAFRDACVAAGFNAALTCLFRLLVGYIYHDPESFRWHCADSKRLRQ